MPATRAKRRETDRLPFLRLALFGLPFGASRGARRPHSDAPSPVVPPHPPLPGSPQDKVRDFRASLLFCSAMTLVGTVCFIVARNRDSLYLYVAGAILIATSNFTVVPVGNALAGTYGAAALDKAGTIAAMMLLVSPVAVQCTLAGAALACATLDCAALACAALPCAALACATLVRLRYARCAGRAGGDRAAALRHPRPLLFPLLAGRRDPPVHPLHRALHLHLRPKSHAQTPAAVRRLRVPYPARGSARGRPHVTTCVTGCKGGNASSQAALPPRAGGVTGCNDGNASSQAASPPRAGGR